MAFDKSKPTGVRKFRLADDDIRTNNDALESAIGQDHDFATGGTQTGRHNHVTLIETADIGAGAAGIAILGAQTASGKPELCFTDEDDDTVQITKAGNINIQTTDLTQVLLDEDNMATNSATKVPSQQSVKAYVDTFALNPVGSIIFYAAAAAPSGWLICDGSAVSRTTYAALFAVIGTIHGEGDGSTTFNLPDPIGRVIIGSGTGDAADATAHALGSKGGTEGVTLTAAQSGLPAHTHAIGYNGGDGGGIRGYGSGYGASFSTLFGTNVIKSNSAANASAAHSNLQPFLALNYIIKT